MIGAGKLLFQRQNRPPSVTIDDVSSYINPQVEIDITWSGYLPVGAEYQLVWAMIAPGTGGGTINGATSVTSVAVGWGDGEFECTVNVRQGGVTTASDSFGPMIVPF